MSAAALNMSNLGKSASGSLDEGIERARRRSRIVFGVRIASLVIMLLIAVNVMLQVTFDQPVLTADIPEAPSGEMERIINPRFTGWDVDGAPFVITALSAVRAATGLTGLTELDQPQLDYSLLGRAGDMSAVLAQVGIYNPVDETLTLNNEVALTTRSGYTFRTDSALLDLENAEIIGENPVRGEAPWGAVRAEEFSVRNRGRHITFTGGVTTRIYEDDRREGASAN